jgi:hypothetical protein
MPIKPYSDIQVTCHQIPKWKRIPNTSLQSKPLMIYHQAFDASADELSEHLQKVGEVSPSWVYSMYSQPHFHSTIHEVLGVVSGSARLCFGGEENPGRFEPTVSKGDKWRILQDGRCLSSKQILGYVLWGTGEEAKCKNIPTLGWFHRGIRSMGAMGLHYGFKT